VGLTLAPGRAAPAAASAESAPRRGGPPGGDFRKVKIAPSPIPESLHFFGSGLMGKQPLGDVALFLATSIETKLANPWTAEEQSSRRLRRLVRRRVENKIASASSATELVC
jgi:hypothetical protein